MLTTPTLPTIAARAVLLTTGTRRSERTREGYARDLADFTDFAGAVSIEAAALMLAERDAPALAELLHAYKAQQKKRSLSPATINRRMAAVRALLRDLADMGASEPPARLVENEKTQSYRDTTGIGLADARALLLAVDANTPAGVRDRALLLLLMENALRRCEVTGASVGDFDAASRRLWIRGKGRTQREPVTLSTAAARAVAEYLGTRGDLPPAAPLFASHSHGRRAEGNRLTGRGLADIVKRRGLSAGIVHAVRPHGLRHTAITAALDATNGDVRAVQKLSRHKQLQTLTVYDDARRDMQGDISARLSELYQ